jgi:transposase-like protein
MGMGAGDGESAKFWMAVLTDLKNRGVADVFFVVCEGLKGLPNSVNTAWPMARVQTCIIHLIRGTFRYASRKYWQELSADLTPIYQAVNADAAAAALDALDQKWASGIPR